MKPLSLFEIESLSREVDEVVGSPLQEVKTTDRSLGLGFWTHGERVWLWLDLKPTSPLLVLFRDDPPRFSFQTRPLGLFLKAHFLGKRLERTELVREFGRVLRLHFTAENSLEIRLIPHQQNILARSGELSIAWNKPQNLAPSPLKKSESESHRPPEEILQEWRSEFAGKGRITAPTTEEIIARWQKDLAKKELAVTRLREDQNREEVPWREIGEALKGRGDLLIPEPLGRHLDPQLRFSENLERAFQNAKKREAKKQVAQLREKELLAEVHELSQRLERAQQDPASIRPENVPSKRPHDESLLKKARAKGRTQELGDGLTLYVGSSGEENLRLLRKAQAWDFWIHLKDFPGAHGILRRKRNQMISDDLFRNAGQWVALYSQSAKRELKEGDPVEVLIAECRHVKPIKGDRLGRVTYQNERVLRFRFTEKAR